MDVMDIDNFRLSFPEFADEGVYPPEMVTFWSSIADKLLNVSRWGDLFDHGRQLFTAHNLVLAAQDAKAGDAGKAPGQQGGVISGKNAGGIGITYDTNSMTIQDAGNFNSTKYGRSFWQLLNIVGMGGAQV